VDGCRFQFLFCVLGLGLLASLIGAFTELTVATEAVARAALETHTQLRMSTFFDDDDNGGVGGDGGEVHSHRAEHSLHRSLTTLAHAADGARALLHTLSHPHPHPRSSSSEASQHSHAAVPHTAMTGAPAAGALGAQPELQSRGGGVAAAPAPPAASTQAPPRLELLQQQPGASGPATPPPGASSDDDGMAVAAPIALTAAPQQVHAPLPRAPPPLPLPPVGRRALQPVERPPSASPPWFVATQPSAGDMPVLELLPAAPPSTGLAPLAFMVRGADERARARAERAARVAARRQEQAAAEQDAAHVNAALRNRRMHSPADWSDA
jgi:hypothetical protein